MLFKNNFKYGFYFISNILNKKSYSVIQRFIKFEFSYDVPYHSGTSANTKVRKKFKYLLVIIIYKF